MITSFYVSAMGYLPCSSTTKRNRVILVQIGLKAAKGDSPMPLDPGEFQITETTEERFDELRPRKGRSKVHPQWEGVLDGLAAGKVIELQAPDPQRANTLRRSLGRMAAGRNMKLEFSGEGTTVIVRKSEKPHLPKPVREVLGKVTGNGRRRGRRPRSSSGPAEAQVG